MPYAKLYESIGERARESAWQKATHYAPGARPAESAEERLSLGLGFEAREAKVPIEVGRRNLDLIAMQIEIARQVWHTESLEFFVLIKFPEQ